MSYARNTATSSSESANIHTATAENVHVRSVVQTETRSKVSMENAKKINDLMARLGKVKNRVNINIVFLFKVQHIFKLMSILVNEMKKLVKLLLNQFEKLLLKLNIINNNFLLMLILEQLVFSIYLFN